MINDLLINVLLLTTITFVVGNILKDIPSKIIAGLYGNVIAGVVGGLLGILLMTYTFQVKGNTTLLDLRVFAIMLVSSIGGILPTIVSGIIIGIFRLLYFGLNMPSIVAVFHILLYIICFHIIEKWMKSEWKKWFLKTLISLIILITFYCYLLRNLENVQTVILQFSFIAISTSILEYFLLYYAKYSNEIYRMYKKDATKDFLTGLYNTRQFNTRESDVIGRIGGEEFCVLLSNCPSD